MTNVYLSIGMPKTGTTAIQTFLRENEKTLKRQGYSFPELKVGVGGRYRNRNGHFLAFRCENPDLEAKAAKEKEAAVREKAYRLLKKQAEMYPQIILSDESIWKTGANTEGFWADAADNFAKIGCQLKVVVYLRRQDLFIQSLWNQNLKSERVRWTRSFDECIKKNRFSNYPMDYYKEIKKISEHLGSENVLVRVYEQGQFAGERPSIYSDFLDCIGLTLTEEYTTESVKQNLGLRGNFIEIKRLLNSVPEYREMKDFMCKPVRLASNSQAQGALHAQTSMFSYEEQKKYLAQFAEGNRKIAKEFLGRDDGQLFYEDVKEYPKWEVEPEYMYRDMILFMTEAFCEQERKILDLQDKAASRDRLFSRIYRKIKAWVKG